MMTHSNLGSPVGSPNASAARSESSPSEADLDNNTSLALVPRFKTWKSASPLQLSTIALTTSVAVAAVGLEPLFSVFLSNAMHDALLGIAQKLKNDPSYTFNPVENFIVYALSYTLGMLGNLPCDITNANPADDVAGLLGLLTKDSIGKLDKSVLTAVAIFTALWAAFSYAEGASADAIPVNNWLKDTLGETWYTNVLNYVSLTTLTSLGVVYYLMFCTRKAYQNIQSFKDDILLDFLGFLGRLSKKPFQYAELAAVVSSNSIYRTIVFMYTAQQVLIKIFGISNGPLFWSLLLATGAGTFSNAVLRGTLASHTEYLQGGDYNLVTWGEMFAALRPGKPTKQTASSIASAIVPILQTAIRAGAPFFIVRDLMAGYGPLVAYSAAFGVGGLFGVHKASVEFCRYATNLALSRLIETETFKQRKAAAQQTIIANLAETYQLIAAAPDVESLANNDDTLDTMAAEVIQKLMKAASANVFVHYGAILTTGMGRIIRLVSFIGFVETLAETLGLNPSLAVLFASSLLWGGAVVTNDQAMYSQGSIEMIATFLVKWTLCTYADKKRSELAVQQLDDATVEEDERSWKSTAVSVATAPCRLFGSAVTYTVDSVAQAASCYLHPLNGENGIRRDVIIAYGQDHDLISPKVPTPGASNR